MFFIGTGERSPFALETSVMDGLRIQDRCRPRIYRVALTANLAMNANFAGRVDQALEVLRASVECRSSIDCAT